jgi:hypothetical protein
MAFSSFGVLEPDVFVEALPVIAVRATLLAEAIPQHFLSADRISFWFLLCRSAGLVYAREMLVKAIRSTRMGAAVGFGVTGRGAVSFGNSRRFLSNSSGLGGMSHRPGVP